MGVRPQVWCSSTKGTKGAQRSRSASLPVWTTHSWKQGPQPERVEESVLIEWPRGEPAPTRCWLACLPKKKTVLAKLVATAKARWRVEQDYRELKDELGLDHPRGTKLAGLHHPVALVTAASSFCAMNRSGCAAAHPAAGTPPASRAHPPERSLPLGSHPLPLA